MSTELDFDAIGFRIQNMLPVFAHKILSQPKEHKGYYHFLSELVIHTKAENKTILCNMHRQNNETYCKFICVLDGVSYWYMGHYSNMSVDLRLKLLITHMLSRLNNINTHNSFMTPLNKTITNYLGIWIMEAEAKDACTEFYKRDQSNFTTCFGVEYESQVIETWILFSMHEAQTLVYRQLNGIGESKHYRFEIPGYLRVHLTKQTFGTGQGGEIFTNARYAYENSVTGRQGIQQTPCPFRAFFHRLIMINNIKMGSASTPISVKTFDDQILDRYPNLIGAPDTPNTQLKKEETMERPDSITPTFIAYEDMMANILGKHLNGVLTSQQVLQAVRTTFAKIPQKDKHELAMSYKYMFKDDTLRCVDKSKGVVSAQLKMDCSFVYGHTGPLSLLMLQICCAIYETKQAKEQALEKQEDCNSYHDPSLDSVIVHVNKSYQLGADKSCSDEISAHTAAVNMLMFPKGMKNVYGYLGCQIPEQSKVRFRKKIELATMITIKLCASGMNKRVIGDAVYRAVDSLSDPLVEHFSGLLYTRDPHSGVLLCVDHNKKLQGSLNILTGDVLANDDDLRGFLVMVEHCITDKGPTVLQPKAMNVNSFKYQKELELISLVVDSICSNGMNSWEVHSAVYDAVNGLRDDLVARFHHELTTRSRQLGYLIGNPNILTYADQNSIVYGIVDMVTGNCCASDGDLLAFLIAINNGLTNKGQSSFPL